jgi:TolB-like protein/DNA-binding winged helix-turn-helix (wHTH) protein
VSTASESRPRSVRFGVFEVDFAARELRKQGRRVRLQEQPFQVLERLLERAGEVVSRDELRRVLWGDAVHVDFDHGLNNAIVRLREVLGDNADAPHFIETIPRHGYRFIFPLAELPPAPAIEAASSPDARTHRRVQWAALGVGLAAALAAAAVLRSNQPLSSREARGEPTAGPPSIAVLPFTSLSSDLEDQHFADGLTEELIDKLARIHGLRVVARSSSSQFKGKRAAAAEIGRALHVAHFLEGSVRRSGDRLRITAQLVDARADEHVWSQTFDRTAGDIFEIQEGIAFAVAAALRVSLLDSDQARVRLRGTSDVEAHRRYTIAQAYLSGRVRPYDSALVKRLLDEAVARDPSYAAAHAGLARFYFRRSWSTMEDPEQSARLGVEAAERALALDPGSSDAVLESATFQFWRHRFWGDYGAYVAAKRGVQRAIELDPANASAFFELCRALVWTEPDVALSSCERVLELDRLLMPPQMMAVTLLGNRGQLAAARERCAAAEARQAIDRCRVPLGVLELAFGNFGEAHALLADADRAAERIARWSLFMALGDLEKARGLLGFGDERFEQVLSAAARAAMAGEHAEAFALLDRGRAEFPYSRVLDLPAARFALIAGQPERALAILAERLPDVVSGIEPISARNLLPALDLATAYQQTGAQLQAKALVERAAAYLDGPLAPKVPMFTYQRARAHALAGQHDAAFRALDRAFDQGLRTTWALDLHPQSLFYVDPIEADPALESLRGDARLARWLARVHAENRRLRAQLRAAGA